MNILAITSMRNEAPHLLEWVAHHLAIGVGHFLIYSNDCDDGTDAMLDLLAAAGVVTHVPQVPRGKRTVQWQALKAAWEHPLLSAADWVLGSDCDEFLTLRAPVATIHDLIAALPDGTDAIAMSWRLFGHSGRIEMADGLTTEQFTRAAPEGLALPLAHYFKSLFQSKAFRQLGVHRPKRHKGVVPNWVNGSGQPLSEQFAKADQRINLFGLPNGSDLVQLNHYSLRAAENFMVKRARGLPNHTEREIGLGYWVERNFNTVEDTSIHPTLPGTRAKLAELMAIDGMAALHAAGFAAHKARFNAMMRERDNVQLFWHLILAADSTPPPMSITRVQVKRILNAMDTDG